LTYGCIPDMFICMRTTINLDDALLRRAKQLAAKTNRTLTSLFQDALREVVNRSGPAPRRGRVKLPVSDRPLGLLPGVDLDNSAALLDLMENQDVAARR